MLKLDNTPIAPFADECPLIKFGLASPKWVDRASLPKFGIEGRDRILGVGLLMQELLKLLSIGARQWLYYGDRGFELRSHRETFKVVAINRKIFSTDRSFFSVLIKF